MFAVGWKTTVQEFGITYENLHRDTKITKISIIRSPEWPIQFVFYSGISGVLNFHPNSHQDIIESAFNAARGYDSKVVDFRTEARIVFETPQHRIRQVNTEFLLVSDPERPHDFPRSK